MTNTNNPELTIPNDEIPMAIRTLNSTLDGGRSFCEFLANGQSDGHRTIRLLRQWALRRRFGVEWVEGLGQQRKGNRHLGAMKCF